MELNTFSITARCNETGDFGVAVCTARPNVGSLVPFVSRKGAIATQARTNTDLGRKGLALLEHGIDIRIALKTLLEQDADRELRQLHGVDAQHTFVFTGSKCVEWCGHYEGKNFTIAGNMLVGPQLIEAMKQAYEAAEQQGLELSERLIRALEAGQKAGGDKRGKQSAALLVASDNPRYYHNLRADEHTDPVAELRRIYQVVVEHTERIRKEYGEEGLRLFSKIKY